MIGGIMGFTFKNCIALSTAMTGALAAAQIDGGYPESQRWLGKLDIKGLTFYRIGILYMSERVMYDENPTYRQQ
jgi:hypothetical protein